MKEMAGWEIGRLEGWKFGGLEERQVAKFDTCLISG
jgi:hypothetical protein